MHGHDQGLSSLTCDTEREEIEYLRSNHVKDQYFKEEDSGLEDVPRNSMNFCMNSWKDELWQLTSTLSQ